MLSCELVKWVFGERVLARVGWMGFWREVGGREKMTEKKTGRQAGRQAEVQKKG